MAYLLRRHEWRKRHIHKMLQQSGHVHHAAAALYSLSRPSGRACSALGAPNRVPRSGSQTHQTHHVRAARTRRNAAPMHPVVRHVPRLK